MLVTGRPGDCMIMGEGNCERIYRKTNQRAMNLRKQNQRGFTNLISLTEGCALENKGTVTSAYWPRDTRDTSVTGSQEMNAGQKARESNLEMATGFRWRAVMANE